MKTWKTGIGILMSGLLLAAAVPTTLGYFHQEEIKENVFTVGDLQIGLREPEWDPEEGDGVCYYPGYTVYKNPTVKNPGDVSEKSQPCYMQIRVTAQDEEGNRIEDPAQLGLIRSTIRFDETYNGSWAETGEAEKLVQGRIPGYSEKECEELPMINPVFEEKDTGIAGEWLFEYRGGENGVLKEEEEAVLFTHIVIPNEWTEKEMDKTGKFQLVIRAEAIQAAGSENREDALAVLGREVQERSS